MADLIEEAELIRLVEGLSSAELNICVTAGWVVPAETGAEPSGRRYLDIDVARVRLIHELRADIGIGDEAIPVVLSLIDQLHDARRQLACLARSLQAEPDEVRRRILEGAAARHAKPF